MNKWHITVDGEPFGSFANEQDARSVFAMVIRPRPKTSYDWRLVNPEGVCVKTVKSSTGKGGAR